MKSRSFFHAMLLGGALLALAVPSAAMASEVRSGASAVVAPGETLNDDLFAQRQTDRGGQLRHDNAPSIAFLPSL